MSDNFIDAIIIQKDTETGNYRSRVNVEVINDTVSAGIMLASATRVIALALADVNQNKGLEEQSIALIAETYKNDLVMGVLGESESFYKE